MDCDTSARAVIFVVDDEPQICAAMARILGTRYAVQTFQRATDALCMIASGARCDLVVSDVSMPEMGGLAFREALARSQRPELAASLIFVTGKSSLPATGNACVEKPFDMSTLVELIETRIKRSFAGTDQRESFATSVSSTAREL